MNLRRGPMLSFALLLGGAPVSAQCALQWQSQGGYSGANGDVWAMVEWDPDGAGPRTPVVVIGGYFTGAGTVAASRIAAFDPATGAWSTFGSGLDGGVRALAVLPNGDLVAGGVFSVAGGVAANRLARWNGTAWSAIGTVAGGQYTLVNALTVAANGDLVVGGDFTSIGGTAANHIARWNGFAWGPLASGVAWSGGSASVTSLAALPNGHIVAGGWFTAAGGSNAIGIARWNGSTWSALGGSVNSAVHAILPMPNGDLVVGGQFGTASGTPVFGVTRWDGLTWWPMGTGLQSGAVLGQVRALARMASGNVIATGFFTTAGGVPAANIARWDGTSWSALGSGLTLGLGQTLLATSSGSLLVGGTFTEAGGVPADRLAQWSGTTWSALSRGLNATVYACLPRRDGRLLVGGSFATAGGVPANAIATWDGSWSALGLGIGGFVASLAELANGDVIAGGSFVSAGGVAAVGVARWNGTAWAAMGTGLTGTVNDLVVMPSGEIVAGGAFLLAGATVVNRVARWDGSTWQPMGTGFDQPVLALAVMPNGDLIAGGQFTYSGTAPVTGIARWDGVAWTPLGGGLSGWVESMVVLDTGDLVAAGSFAGSPTTIAPDVARWDGSAWHAMGTGITFLGVRRLDALSALPGGSVLLGGLFTGIDGVPCNGLARWSGGAWTALAGADYWIRTLAPMPGGVIAVGGTFDRVGGAISPYFATLSTPCVASAGVIGAGCTGSGGANVLAATDLPWLGSTCRAQATGLPANGLALAIVGFAPTSIPLSTLLPQGVAGCTQLVTLDRLDLLVPTAGQATASVSIPNALGLVGLTFRQQVVPIELDVANDIVAVTASNALLFTVGAW